MNRAYTPSTLLDMSKYILWYYKAFLTGQIGVGFTVLATTITAATPSAAGGTLADGTYYYQVTALNGGNESAPSNEVFATVTGGGSGSVALTWTAVSGATGYRVYRGTAAGVESVFYAPGAVTTYTDINAASSVGSPPATGTWVVVGSSDASTAGMDGLDRWTNSYVAGKVNRNNAGSAHSWVVLRCTVQMASKQFYLLLDWSTSFDHALTTTFGDTTPPVGGNINTAPTLANLAACTSLPFSANAGLVPMHLHGALATDGSFNLLVSSDFTMKFRSGFLLHLLAAYKVTDLYPVWMSLAGEIGAQQMGLGYGTSGAAPDLGYISNSAMRYPDNTNSGQVGIIQPTGTNLPSAPDLFDGTFADWPALVGNKVVGNTTLRGRLQDIYYFPNSTGTAVPSTGAVDNPAAPEYMLVGQWWLPTNAIPNIY
jgi:hypothetical protein